MNDCAREKKPKYLPLLVLWTLLCRDNSSSIPLISFRFVFDLNYCVIFVVRWKLKTKTNILCEKNEWSTYISILCLKIGHSLHIIFGKELLSNQSGTNKQTNEYEKWIFVFWKEKKTVQSRASHDVEMRSLRHARRAARQTAQAQHVRWSVWLPSTSWIEWRLESQTPRPSDLASIFS